MLENKNDAVIQSPQALAVHVVQTQETYRCAPGETVLAGMAKLGRKGIPVGCLNGGCGVCKVEILSGEYECGLMSKVHVSEQEQNRRVVLACRVKPRTDLVLKVVGKMCKSVLRCEAGAVTKC
jgi:ferredoxin